MCAVFGYLDYKGKVNNAILKKLIRNLSIAAEVRGTDATGISYVNHGKVVTFKKAKPAHKVKLYFPKNTRAVIGHTRMTTQAVKNTITTTIHLRDTAVRKHLPLYIMACCTMMLN